MFVTHHSRGGMLFWESLNSSVVLIFLLTITSLVLCRRSQEANFPIERINRVEHERHYSEDPTVEMNHMWVDYGPDLNNSMTKIKGILLCILFFLHNLLKLWLLPHHKFTTA